MRLELQLPLNETRECHGRVEVSVQAILGSSVRMPILSIATLLVLFMLTGCASPAVLPEGGTFGEDPNRGTDFRRPRGSGSNVKVPESPSQSQSPSGSRERERDDSEREYISPEEAERRRLEAERNAEAIREALKFLIIDVPSGILEFSWLLVRGVVWDAPVWIGEQVWEGAKWTGETLWSGPRWLGAQIGSLFKGSPQMSNGEPSSPVRKQVAVVAESLVNSGEYDPTEKTNEKGEVITTTRCNLLVQDIAAEAFGYQGFKGLRANGIIDRVTSAKDEWEVLTTERSTEDALAAAQERANAGSLVVVGWKNPIPERPGHVAVVLPGDRVPCAWDYKVPRVAQAGVEKGNVVGGTFAGIPLSWGFKKDQATRLVIGVLRESSR